MDIPPNKPKSYKWLIITLAIVFCVIIILVGTSFALAQKYENKIFPGVRVDDVDLGGLTQMQAGNILSGKFKATYDAGFVFSYQETDKKIENSEELFQLNLESLVETAYNYGRGPVIWQNQLKLLTTPLLQKKITLDYQLDKKLLKEKLQEGFRSLENPSKDAELVIKTEEGKQYQLSFIDDVSGGVTFDYNKAIGELEIALLDLKNPKIKLEQKKDFPRITTKQAQTLEPEIQELLELEAIKFKFEGQAWPVKWEDFAQWLTLALNEDEVPMIALNEEMVLGQIEAIAQEIDQEAVDAKLQIKDNRVTEFKASQNGQKLDLENSFLKTVEALIENKANEIELIVNITEPEVSIASTNELGIKELVGVGVSNFSGSPANRRHNISVGSTTLNGVLIKPDEEFSLMAVLGDIDGQHGYKPELVIKDNATIPEYGGGLCQIGTTMFRVALASGLPITERKEHSYRVVYYEPAGTDATVYQPRPDVRFLNDTGHYILIQTKIEGNNLIFEFWGTADGRTVLFEGENETANLAELKPKIFNITVPGPAREIETTELAPGERRKTDSAHNGADTVFYRTVTKVDGTKEQETWRSHYVAWRAAYLVGVDPEKEEKDVLVEGEEKEVASEDSSVVETEE